MRRRLKQIGVVLTLVRPETKLSPQDIETICAAARQAEVNAADERRHR